MHGSGPAVEGSEIVPGQITLLSIMVVDEAAIPIPACMRLLLTNNMYFWLALSGWAET